MSKFSEISTRFAMLYSSIYASSYRETLSNPYPRADTLNSYSRFKKSIKKEFKGIGSYPDISHDTLKIGEYFTGDFNAPISDKNKYIGKEFNKLNEYVFDFRFLAKCGFTDEDIKSLNITLLKDSSTNKLLNINDKTFQSLQFNTKLKQKGIIRDIYGTIILVAGIIAGLATMGIGAVIGISLWLWYKGSRNKKGNYKAQIGLLKSYNQHITAKDKQVISLSGVKYIYKSVEDLVFGRALYQILNNIGSLCDEKGMDKSKVMKVYQKRLVKIHDHFYKRYESEIENTELLLNEHSKEYAEIQLAKTEEDTAKAKRKEEWDQLKVDAKKEFNKFRSKLAETIDSK